MRKVTLSSLVDIQIGKTPSRSNTEYWGQGADWLTIADLSNLENGKYATEATEQITEKAIQKSGCKLIPENTILFSFKLSIGKVAITRKPFYTNEAIAALVIKPDNDTPVSVEFLFYALKSMKFEKNADHSAKGVTLNKASLGNLIIRVPEPDIQNKIVALLNKIHSIIIKRQKSISLYEKVIRSFFYDFFGDPVINKKGFPKTKLSQIGDWKSGGTPSRRKDAYFNGTIPWFTSGELNEVFLSESKEFITSAALSETSAKLVEKNSLLIGMYDTAALKSSIVSVDCSCNQAVAFAKLDDSKANALFVYYAIQLSKEYYLSKRRGARQKNLNLGIIKNIEIPLPEKALQKDFAKKAMQQLQTQKKLRQSQIILQTIFNAAIQQAFINGDFVSEEKVFEDLLCSLQINSFLENRSRIKYLADLVNSQEIFLEVNYEKAKDFIFQLLQLPESGLIQKYNPSKEKLEISLVE